MIRDTGIRAGLLMKQVLIQLSNRSREGFGRQIVGDGGSWNDQTLHRSSTHAHTRVRRVRIGINKAHGSHGHKRGLVL